MYTEHDVSIDRHAADEMVDLTGQMGVPVIVVDGEAVIGFNRPRLGELLEAQTKGKVTLGLSIADASGILQDNVGRARSGAYVGEVKAASLGARAGLKAGDIITEINSLPINNAADLARIVASFSSGDRVSFSVNRGRDYLKADVVI